MTNIRVICEFMHIIRMSLFTVLSFAAGIESCMQLKSTAGSQNKNKAKKKEREREIENENTWGGSSPFYILRRPTPSIFFLYLSLSVFFLHSQYFICINLELLQCSYLASTWIRNNFYITRNSILDITTEKNCWN